MLKHLFLGFALTLAACGGSSPEVTESVPEAEPEPEPTEAIEPEPVPKWDVDVSEATFEGDWPFSVASGEVRCNPWGPVTAVTFAADNGVIYPLNGGGEMFIADLDGKENVPDLREIWKHGDKAQELRELGADEDSLPRVSISPLIDLGRSLCEE